MATEPVDVFDRRHRRLTVGILLGVTLFAFEAMAVVTVAPRFAEALGGLDLYGWVFSGFLLGSLLGAVASGQVADRRGPGPAFALGLLLFATGLVLAGFAPSMPVLVGGRVLQGLGGGTFGTSLYVAINLAYPDGLRPRMMALSSSAWVLPALIGPAGAGLLAELVSWRLVFWGILPLLLLTGLLTLPALLALRPQRLARGGNRIPAALLLVAGTTLILFALGAQVSPWRAALGAVGLLLIVPALRRLVPEGSLRLAPGLPSVVAARGTFYAAFVGVEAFLALMLTTLHGYSSVVTGATLAGGAISWTAGSWLQERLDARAAGRRRPRRVLLGTLILAVGLALQLATLFATRGALAFALAGWLLAGLGIGLAHATSSVLAFGFAPSGEEGAVAASLQLADQFTSALSTGVGGALFAWMVAAALGERTGVLLALLFSLLLALTAVAAAARISGRGAAAPPRAEPEPAPPG